MSQDSPSQSRVEAGTRLDSSARDSSHSLASQTPAMLASALSAVALALFLLSGLSVFSQLLPLRLLQPAWQLRVSQVLLENGLWPLLGLVLLQLAPYLDPSHRRLQARWQRLGRLGVIAVLGFLLLMPLQLVAASRSLQGMSNTQRVQQQRVERNLNRLRQEIRAAGSLGDLQQRIRAIEAPDLVLDAGSLSQGLPQLKQSLLASVDQSERQLRRRFSRGQSGRTWAVLERSGRGILSSLILAFGFAACTPQWNDPHQSLLISWQSRWRRLRQRRPGKRQTLSDKDYLRQLAGNEKG